MDKDLFQTTGEIKIDYVNTGMAAGFSITSTNPVGGAAAGCGSGCSC